MEHEKHNEYLNVLKMLDFTYERSRKYYFLISLIEKVLNDDNKINIGFINGFVLSSKNLVLNYIPDNKNRENINFNSNFIFVINILGCLINDILIHPQFFIKYDKNNINIVEHLKLSFNSLNELMNINKIISSPQYFDNIIFKNDCQKLTTEILNYEYEKYKNIDKFNINFFNKEKKIKNRFKIYRDLISYNIIKINNKDFFNFLNINLNAGLKYIDLSFTDNFNKYKNKTLISSTIILQSYYIFDDLYNEILNDIKDEKRKEYIKNLIDKTTDLNKHEILQHLTFDELFNSLYC